MPPYRVGIIVASFIALVAAGPVVGQTTEPVGELPESPEPAAGMAESVVAGAVGDTAPMAEADYTRGLDLTKTDPTNAVKAFLAAAGAGNPGAMFELGWAFEIGRGVAADLEQAVSWYDRAVATGEPRAMNNLGWLYAQGTGVPRDPARAVALYRRGAEAGEPSAMNNLGWMLENGIGTQQDLAGAAAWYTRAADLGDSQAMLALGNLHLVGDGADYDPSQALTWFARARAAGRVEALSYMGEVFETAPQMHDPERAAGFYLRALEAGDSWPISRASRSWDAETARALQTMLEERGLYAGGVDGAIGAASRAAMQALLDG